MRPSGRPQQINRHLTGSEAAAAAGRERWSPELWLQTGSVRLEQDRLDVEKRLLRPDMGVEVRKGAKTAFCRPGVATEYHGRELIPILEALCEKLGQPPESWREPEVECRLGSWVRLASAASDDGSEAAVTLVPGASLLNVPLLSASLRDQLLRSAHLTLDNLFRDHALPLAAELAALDALPSAERVNVTLRRDNQIRGSMSAGGASLLEQLVKAVQQAALDNRFGGPLRRWELAAVRIEVWVQTASQEIPPGMRSSVHSLRMGHHGVEVRAAKRFAYYKPSVAITSSHKTPARLFRALCRKARLDKSAWQDPGVSLRRTSWVVCSSAAGAEAEPSHRGLLDQTSAWIRNCTRYLVENQDCTGNTAYLYDPVADLTSTAEGNRVRASGCMFALAQVLHSSLVTTLEPSIVAGIANMASGLLGTTIIDREGRRVVPSDKRGESPKLGASALLAAALSFEPLRGKFNTEFNELYQSVVAAQLPSGRFTTRMDSATENPGEMNFSPGQALLLLAFEAERGVSEALWRCDRAFVPYRDHFRATPASAFVGWQVDVWARLGALTADRRYIDFAFEQVDWLLRMQILDHHDPRYVGGFAMRGRVPKYSSIVFAEAVARGLGLALALRDEERIARYGRAVRLGARFARQLRLEEAEASLLADPARCRGGVALELLDLRVRCDVVQHFITFCLLLQNLYNLPEGERNSSCWQPDGWQTDEALWQPIAASQLSGER